MCFFAGSLVHVVKGIQLRKTGEMLWLGVGHVNHDGILVDLHADRGSRQIVLACFEKHLECQLGFFVVDKEVFLEMDG